MNEQLQTLPQPTKLVSEEVLVVDLDGTLIATDLLVESFFNGVKDDPRLLLRLPALLVGSRANLKRQLALASSFDPATLPYRREVLDFIEQQRERGVSVVLATAADAILAKQVADYLGLFDAVLASDGVTNLKSSAKAAAIHTYLQHGEKSSFAYMGDSSADLAIWKEAATSIVVAPSAALLRNVNRLGTPVQVIARRTSTLRAVVKAMRPKQWMKNLLLFVPLITAHQWHDPNKILHTIIAFAAFCLCASSVYVVNDLLDVPADRHHPRKRHRPFASGALPLTFGPPLALALLFSGLSLAGLLLPPAVVGLLTIYLLLSSAYSFWLKSKIIVDVVLLAMLYALRIVAGGAATEIVISEWLASFSLFIFTSLAFAKRYAELIRIADEDAGDHVAKGRGYLVRDLRVIESLGPACGLISVLVLALYISSPQVKLLYHEPRMLWLLCPLLLYWVARLWLVAGRKELSEDPVMYAVSDPRSLAVAALTGTIIVVGSIAW